MPKNTHNQPTSQPENIIADVQAMPIEEAEKVVSLARSKGKRRNIFEADDTAISEALADKVQLVGETRQRVAEAADYYQQGGEKEKEGEVILDRVARDLVSARISGVITSDEVTAIIGDGFGFRTKKDGTPSKTPDGAGNGLRQRIVRMVNAYDFVADGVSDDAFFSPISADAVDSVKEVLESFEAGPDNNGLTVWKAYKTLSDIKRDNVQRTPFIEDAKKIGGLATAISENVSELAEMLASNPALRASYRSLWKMLNVVAEEAANMEEAA